MAVKKKSVSGRLQRMIDGHLKSKAEVKAALKKMEKIADEIAEIEERHGLPAKRAEAVALKKAATDYMAEHEIETVELDKSTGRYARLIRSHGNRRWVLRVNELDGAAPPEGFKSLSAILKKKFGSGYAEAWRIATKRVADPAGIEELVKSRVISEKELAPAYIEEARAPFVRIFGSKEEDDA